MGESKAISDMSDREIAEETLEHMRMIMAAIEGISSNPMLKAMMPAGVLGQ